MPFFLWPGLPEHRFGAIPVLVAGAANRAPLSPHHLCHAVYTSCRKESFAGKKVHLLPFTTANKTLRNFPGHGASQLLLIETSLGG